MAIEEDIIVNIKAVSDVKKLVQFNEDVKKLNRVGIKVNKGLRDMSGKLVGVNKVAKQAGSTFRRFKFEMLGVLFFGMGIARLFTGLIKPALDMVGAFQIMNTTLGIFFLPTALNVNAALLEMQGVLLGLPAPVQDFAGNLTLVGVGSGILLQKIGELSLGLISLKIAFPTLALGLLLKRFAAIAIAVTIITTLFENWEKISFGLKTTLGLVLAVVGLIAVALGSPFIAVIAIVTSAIIALKLIVTDFKDELNAVIGLLNRLPGINIAPIGSTAPEGLRPIGAEAAAANQLPSVRIDTIAINVDVTSGGSPQDVIDAIERGAAEAVARGVGDIARSR